jgi:hypothetical protein
LSDNDFSGSRHRHHIISAQYFWTGGLETAGPGCYDVVAIARAAGFRMLVMSRIRHATIVPNRLEPAKKSGQNIPKNHFGANWRSLWASNRLPVIRI